MNLSLLVGLSILLVATAVSGYGDEIEESGSYARPLYVKNGEYNSGKRDYQKRTQKPTHNKNTYNNAGKSRYNNNNKPYNKQQYNSQPQKKQQYNSQAYNKQQYNSQPYNKQPYYNSDSSNYYPNNVDDGGSVYPAGYNPSSTYNANPNNEPYNHNDWDDINADRYVQWHDWDNGWAWGYTTALTSCSQVKPAANLNLTALNTQLFLSFGSSSNYYDGGFRRCHAFDLEKLRRKEVGFIGEFTFTFSGTPGEEFAKSIPIQKKVNVNKQGQYTQHFDLNGQIVNVTNTIVYVNAKADLIVTFACGNIPKSAGGLYTAYLISRAPATTETDFYNLSELRSALKFVKTLDSSQNTFEPFYQGAACNYNARGNSTM